MKKFEIGKSYAQVSQSDTDDNELVLDIVWVAEDQRGQGIGKQLTQMAIDYAREQNKKLGLYAEPQDGNGLNQEALVEFYRNMGFESDGDCNELMSIE